MLHDVIVAICSAASGALVPIVTARINEKKEPDTFGFGLCEGLTEHDWAYTHQYGGKYVCPKCDAAMNLKQHPKFCPERSGHYHIRCTSCAYEFAMVSCDVEKPIAQKESTDG